MTEYDLGKVVGDDGEAGNGIASITKTGTSGLVDTYTITYDDGTTTTFTVTNGSNASVTIQTSWGSTTSDSKVPSEKLTKDTLDTKIAKSSTTGLVKNDGTIMTSGTGSTNYSAGNHTHSGYISTSSTSGLIKNDGSIMTGGTGSSNWAIGNHTHSGYVSATKVTSWSGTVSDSNVPSEKLVKNSLDDKISKSSTSGLVKNDGTIDTSSYLTTGSASSTYQPKLVSGTNIKTINNESLLGSGNITIQGGSSVDIVTAWESTPSDSKVPSEKLVYDSIIGKIDDVSESGDVFYHDDSTNGHIYLFNRYLDFNVNDNSVKYNSSELATVSDIPSLTNYVQKSSTSGLLKNDGSVDTNTYLTSSAISGMLTTSDVVDNLTSTSTTAPLSAKQGKVLNDLIGQAIAYINQ